MFPALRLGFSGSSCQFVEVNDECILRLRKLVLLPGMAELGPTPRSGVLTAAGVDAELAAVFRARAVDGVTRELVRGLLLLWHDHLDASHTVSQAIENQDGSLIHAVMHRREPDYWNSKYWWRHASRHPCFGELGLRVAEFLRQRSESELAARLVPGGQWDAFAFVDECEVVAGAATGQRKDLLRELQQIETQVALQHFLGGQFPLEFALP